MAVNRAVSSHRLVNHRCFGTSGRVGLAPGPGGQRGVAVALMADVRAGWVRLGRPNGAGRTGSLSGFPCVLPGWWKACPMPAPVLYLLPTLHGRSYLGHRLGGRGWKK